MSKKIVFCADGTWEHPADPTLVEPVDTNVYKLYRALLVSATQVPHYDDGVGADGTPVDRILGGGMGVGLFQKIKDGYTFIAQSYQPGDEVFLFGFSRGAYTARSLAGMLAACGLPAQGQLSTAAVNDAFRAYRDRTSNRPNLLASLQAKYGNQKATVSMVGVWDTVGSLGIPVAIFAGFNEQLYGFLDTSLHPDVKAAYHALSINERRREFPPTLWNALTPAAIQSGQILEQVWFAGCHSGVGGGYAETGLSDITMSWMMGKAASRGLEFDANMLAQYTNLDPKHSLDFLRDSWNVYWLFPKTRDVPVGSWIANSVDIRINQISTYRPDNLKVGAENHLGGYQIVNVVQDAPSAGAP
jgi:uncharacterized protein (DUF2235 family)